MVFFKLCISFSATILFDSLAKKLKQIKKQLSFLIYFVSKKTPHNTWPKKVHPCWPRITHLPTTQKKNVFVSSRFVKCLLLVTHIHNHWLLFELRPLFNVFGSLIFLLDICVVGNNLFSYRNVTPTAISLWYHIHCPLHTWAICVFYWLSIVCCRTFWSSLVFVSYRWKILYLSFFISINLEDMFSNV